jgi:hypothetical protein
LSRAPGETSAPAVSSRASWIPVAEGVFCPAVATWGERGLSLFLRGPRGELLYRERDGGSWKETRSLGVPAAQVHGSGGVMPIDWPIAACSTGDGRVHLLARGPEGELLHGKLCEGEWSGFACIGLPAMSGGVVPVPMGLAGAPTACSRERGRMDVFAPGADGDLLQANWDESGFTEFGSLGRVAPDRRGMPDMPVSGALSACSCGNRRMAVFTRGVAGDLLCKWWNGTSWSPFASLGAPQEDDVFYPGNLRMVPLSGPPVACGGGSALLDVFARGGSGDLLHKRWDGKTWTEFESLGMPFSTDASTPVPFTGTSLACAWGRYQLDVFALGADGTLYNLQEAAVQRQFG